jgi:hypothetical protein
VQQWKKERKENKELVKLRCRWQLQPFSASNGRRCRNRRRTLPLLESSDPNRDFYSFYQQSMRENSAEH